METEININKISQLTNRYDEPKPKLKLKLNLTGNLKPDEVAPKKDLGTTAPMPVRSKKRKPVDGASIDPDIQNEKQKPDTLEKEPKKESVGSEKQKQKIDLLKRNDPDPEEDLEQINLEWINQKLESGKREVLEKYTSASKEEREKYLFYNRCKILKPIRSKGVLAEEWFEKHWPAEIEYLKNNKFPYGWMEENPQIEKMNRKHKALMPVCNLLRNMARNSTEKEKEKMVILSRGTVHTTKKMVKDQDGKEKLKTNHWPIFCFQTDLKFYAKIAKETGNSTKTIQRYILSMTEFGMLQKVNERKQNHGVPVYSFGYYLKHAGKDLFHHWVTKATYKDTLQDFHLCK